LRGPAANQLVASFFRPMCGPPTNRQPADPSSLSLSLDAPPWKAGRAAMAAGSGWHPHVVEPIRLCALPTTLYKSRRGCLPQNPSQLGISLPNPPLVTSRREKWGSRRWGRLSGRVTARREDRSRPREGAVPIAAAHANIPYSAAPSLHRVVLSSPTPSPLGPLVLR
jgi:hypothetical protein